MLEASPMNRRRKVLLVDDDVALRTSLAEQLAVDYDTAEAGTGSDALAVAKSEPFDAILLDIGLPDTDGRQVCRKMRDDGSIMHAEVRIDDSVVMVGERPDGRDPVRGSTHVYVPDVDACYAAGLAAGASSVTPPTDQPYGDRSAGLRDPEGHLWWIGTHQPNEAPSPA